MSALPRTISVSAAAIRIGSCSRAATSLRNTPVPPPANPTVEPWLRAKSGARSQPINLANLITLGRLLAVPLVVWLILSGDYTLTFWVFAAASVSDAIDGYVAKHFDQRSDLGALLDPIADKTLIVSLFVTLGLAGDLPTWLVILVVFRDLLIMVASSSRRR